MKLCECGCGQPAPIAKWNNERRGHVKGQPIRFIPGHHNRVSRPPLTVRFWNNVQRGSPDECWEWQGRLTTWGYGRIGSGGERTHAHRISYKLHNGPIPDGMFVCHSCDNPRCVNPAHLFLGTPGDNMRDMKTKGRGHFPGAPGERNRFARLTNEQVLEIRQLREQGFALTNKTDGEQGLTQQAIADRCGVGQTTVSDIVCRRKWKHI